MHIQFTSILHYEKHSFNWSQWYFNGEAAKRELRFIIEKKVDAYRRKIFIYIFFTEWSLSYYHLIYAYYPNDSLMQHDTCK